MTFNWFCFPISSTAVRLMMEGNNSPAAVSPPLPQEVMMRHFGVTQKQALRTQALLRLGVTEADVKIAERLLVSRSEGADNVCVFISKLQTAIFSQCHLFRKPEIKFFLVASHRKYRAPSPVPVLYSMICLCMHTIYLVSSQ